MFDPKNKDEARELIHNLTYNLGERDCDYCLNKSTGFCNVCGKEFCSNCEETHDKLATIDIVNEHID